MEDKSRLIRESIELKGWLPIAKLKKYKIELSDLGTTWVR